jgi:hypothetical protein
MSAALLAQTDGNVGWRGHRPSGDRQVLCRSQERGRLMTLVWEHLPESCAIKRVGRDAWLSYHKIDWVHTELHALSRSGRGAGSVVTKESGHERE